MTGGIFFGDFSRMLGLWWGKISQNGLFFAKKC
jgi:hypothetical protein